MVELHSDMLEKVQKLAHLLRTQDNRCTHLPVFMVQREELVSGLDPNHFDTIGWFHCDSDGLPEDDEEAAALEAAYDDTGEVPNDYYRCGYRYEWRNVQPFLTEEGAKEYIRINGHNLGIKTRIYVESGYRNAEWQFMRELILELGKEQAPGPHRSVVEIPKTDDLDAITLHLTDHGPGRGELTATCFGRSWTAYWGGMGADRDVASFVASVGSDYLAGKLGGSWRDEYTLRISRAIISHLRSMKEVSRG